MKRWEARYRGLDGKRCTCVSAVFRDDAGPEEVEFMRGETWGAIARKHSVTVANSASWKLVEWDLAPKPEPPKP